MGQNKLETRALNVELRNTGTDTEPILEGLAVPYGQVSDGLPWDEVIAPGAFSDDLKEGRDVFALMNHDPGQVLGRRANDTLTLEETGAGIMVRIKPNTGTGYGKDAVALVERGDIKNMSFGFVAIDDDWTSGKGRQHRTIKKASLYEVSIVPAAAYGVTNISKRNGEEELLTKEMETKQEETRQEGINEGTSQGTKQKETRTIPAVAITTGTDAKQEQREAFNHYLRTGEIREGTALMTVGNTGAIAPVDFAKEIIDGLKDAVVMRQLARILPAISGKSAAYPRRTGGTGAAMVGEGEAITPYNLEFDQVTLVPKKAAALIEVSNELLQDEGVDLAGYLVQHFVDEIGELLEGQYWLGDATGANLQGILTADDGDAVDPALLIERVPTAGVTIDADDILNLWAALPAKYRRNAVFVCNSAMEAVLRGLQDGNDQYLMVANLATGMGNTLLGRPLVVAETFPGDLTAGDDALMVGDFSRGVYIADKAGIDIQRNDSIGFNKDTTAFRAIFRTDIALAWPDAMRVLAVKSN